MKDFAKEYLKKKKENQCANPLLYTTPQIQEELLEMQTEAIGLLSACNMLGVLLTAPFQTIVSSLQLSVKPHKQLFVDPEAKTQAVAKLNTSLTLQEKRRMELMLRAGGQQKPYIAPVYEGYIGAIKGLAQQGFNAFFKGLAFRSVHNMARLFALSQVSLTPSGHNDPSVEGVLSLVQLGKIYLLQNVADFSVNFLHIAENRYILQNNLPEFRVFRSSQRTIRNLFLSKQILTGASYHLINNIGQVFMKIPLLLSISTRNFNLASAGLYYLTEIIQYPFNTAFRRVVCQHKTLPGMIPVRYSSVLHAVRLIFHEQGFLGLYKGFGLQQVNITMRLLIIAIFHPVLMQISQSKFIM